MTQKFNFDKIDTQGNPAGYILRVSEEGVPAWEEAQFGLGSIDSIQAAILYSGGADSNNIQAVDFVLKPNVDSGQDIGSRVRPFKKAWFSGKIYLGQSEIKDSDGIVVFTNANGEEFRIGDFDSQALIDLIDSQFVADIIGDATGPQGLQGIQGARGSQGIQGIQKFGPYGVIGVQGPTGPGGPQGVQGTQGLQGTDGILGAQGTQGANGVQGFKGPQGVQGVQGDGGFVPPPLQGVCGCVGPQGIQGRDGSDGIQGVQGLRGPRGIQGPRGLCGIQGATGPQGNCGPQGIRGPIGNDYCQIQGVQGTQGFIGFPGAQGPTGSAGSTYRCLANFKDGFGPCNGGFPGAVQSVFMGCCAGWGAGIWNGSIAVGASCWTCGCGNTGLGTQALTSGVSQISSTCWQGRGLCWICNTAIGHKSLCSRVNNFSSDNNIIQTNTAIGYGSLAGVGKSTCELANVAIGSSAGQIDINKTNKGTGCTRFNVSIGQCAGCSCGNNKYSYNVDIGNLAGNYVVPSAVANNQYGVCRNVHIGSWTRFNSNGLTRDVAGACNNVFIGRPTTIDGWNRTNTAIGDGFFVIDASTSVAIGNSAYVASGTNLTAVGFGAVATGAFGHTAIGRNSVACGSLGDNIVIGVNGRQSSANARCQLTLGNANHTTIRSNSTTITSLSDCRDKTCINNIPYGLNFLKEMRPVEFTWNRRREILNLDSNDSDVFAGKPDLGFLAQELQQVESVFNSKEFTKLVLDDNPNRLEATPHRAYPIIIKAIQDLSNQIDRIKTKIENATAN